MEEHWLVEKNLKGFPSSLGRLVSQLYCHLYLMQQIMWIILLLQQFFKMSSNSTRYPSF